MMLRAKTSGCCYLFEYPDGLFRYQDRLYVARRKWYSPGIETPQTAPKKKAIRCADGEMVWLDGGTTIYPVEEV